MLNLGLYKNELFAPNREFDKVNQIFFILQEK